MAQNVERLPRVRVPSLTAGDRTTRSGPALAALTVTLTMAEQLFAVSLSPLTAATQA